MKALTVALLALADKPYGEYNAALKEIKGRLPLDVQVATFERVLAEELPLTTARRAYRTAIMVAMGEDDVHREHKPEAPRRGSGGKRP